MLLAACSATGGSASAADRAAEHARTAGVVMTRPREVRAAGSAAALVAGDVDGTRIDVLRAAGTTRSGDVVLRIAVSDSTGAFGSTDTSTRCFAYHFAHTLDDARPAAVPCPSGPALRSSPPPLAPGVDAATQRSVRRALASLRGVERVDPSAVRAAVRDRLGPRYAVTVGGGSARVDVHVASGGQCLAATVSARAVFVGRPDAGPGCDP